MISICSLIYRSTTYADAVWKSLHENTPHLHDGRAVAFFVANDPTETLVDHLTARGYSFVIQKNRTRTKEELAALGYEEPEYMHRVYRGWNRAIMESEEQCVLVSSDMMFASGWLEGLLSHWTPSKIVSAQLIERQHPRHGMHPRAVYKDFGSSPRDFRDEAFQGFAREAMRSGDAPGGTYGPWILSRRAAIAAGLYPEGNGGEGYGDVAFVRRMQVRGVEHITALNSIVYHFKEGEMDDALEEAA